MKHKPFTRILSLLLVVATLAGLLAVPASAASLNGSGSVTIQQAGFGNYLSKSTGGSIGGGYWKYTSNDGLTGTAYCVNWGLKGVSPSKSLTIQEYNRNPRPWGPSPTAILTVPWHSSRSFTRTMCAASPV